MNMTAPTKSQDIDLINIAAQLVIREHKGFDKSGIMDFLHPIGVYTLVASHTPHVKMAALLHDIVEDSLVTVNQLRAAYGFPKEVVEAVDRLTRRKKEPYRKYIERLHGNGIARIVKLADIKYNLSRVDFGVSKKDAARMRKKWEDARRYIVEGFWP
jgi:(p)ppGpp synthase/HD superfamily hydrolase